MRLYLCYNTNVTFDPIRLRNFVRIKFAEWRGPGRASLVDYAKHADMSQQTMSNLYNGKFKRRPEPETYGKLVKLYGVEVYDVLDLPRPNESEVLSKLREDLRESVDAALEEIRSSALNNGKENVSPEELEKINEILRRHLDKFQDTM